MALHLIRHGETAWSRARRHTGCTDVVLTLAGEQQAREVGRRLAGVPIVAVWTSPALRARRTAELAALGPDPRVLDALREFDYGQYEGLTTQAIRDQRPGWALWRDGCAGGESPVEVLARAGRALAAIRAESPAGDVAIVSHGHFLRALAVAYLGLPIAAAAGFVVDVASITILGEEHGFPAVRLWNLSEASVPDGRPAPSDRSR